MRLDVVTRMVDIANRQACQLFVIAGDLFENVRVPKAKVRETAAALKQFQGLVLVLPGNHDCIQEADDPARVPVAR